MEKGNGEESGLGDEEGIGKETFGGEDEPGRGMRAVRGDDEGENWGEGGRELCFIADFNVMLGVERPLARETGSDLGLNIAIPSSSSSSLSTNCKWR
jgi:hypothetical protein